MGAVVRWPAWGLALSAVLVAACRAILGDLDECKVDADCPVASDPLICSSGLCVRGNPRCSVVGPQTRDAVRIGMLVQLTTANGQPLDRGVNRRNVVELALRQLNPPVRQGVRGRPLQAIVCDTSGDPAQASALASYLADRGVPAILSGSSRETLSAATVTTSRGILLMSTSATSPEITALRASVSPRGPRLVWRTAPSDEHQARVMASEIAGETDAGTDGSAPFDRVALVGPEVDPYVQGIVSEFGKSYAGSSGAYLYEASKVREKVTDALTYATGGATAGTVVVIAQPEEAANIVSTGAEIKPRYGRWFFTDSSKSTQLLNRDLVDRAGLVGARGTVPSTENPGEAYTYFRQMYVNVYPNSDPATVGFLPNTFDAVMLIAIATDWAASEGITGTRIADGLGRLSATEHPPIALTPLRYNEITSALARGEMINVEGASGALDFDPTVGQAPGNIEVWTIRNDDAGLPRFETLRVVAPQPR